MRRGPSGVSESLGAVCIVALVACSNGGNRSRSGKADSDSRALVRLVALGDSQITRGAYDSARRTLNDAVARGGRSGDSAAVARGWTSICILDRYTGHFDEAELVGERSASLKRRLGLNGELARTFNALGNLANARGNYDAAVVRFRETRDAAEAVHDSVYVARARGNIGLAYANMGDLDHARTELLAFRDLASARHDARDEANALNNLGKVEARAGNPVAAIAWLNQARRQYDSIQFAVGEENALGQLGVAWREVGETSRALAYFDSALTLATRNGLLEPETDDLVLSAEVYEDAGDHRRALEVLGRARMLADSLKMESKLGHILLTEAHAYSGLGLPRLALTRATDAADHQHAADSPMDELIARLDVAEFAERTGDSAAAATAIGNARLLADKLGSGIARIQLALGSARVADIANRSDAVLAALASPVADAALLSAGERAEAEGLRARALFRRGEYRKAADAGRLAVDAVERLSRQVGSASLRTSYLSERSRAYADLVITLLALNKVDDAFRVADAARGRALIDQLSVARRDLPRTGAAGDLVAADSLLQRINALVEQLRIADTTRRSPEATDRATNRPSATLESALATARASYDSLLDRMNRSASRGAIVGASTVDVPSIQRSLAPGERVVEYFTAQDRLLIFVVSPQRVQFVKVPVSDTAIAEQARLARDLVATRNANASAPLSALYANLVRPLEQRELLAGADRLIVVPHDALTYLPFAALRASDSAPYLAERFSVVMLTSASALVPLRRARPAATRGNEVFAPLTKELPASRDEAAAVSRTLAANPTIDASASELAVRRALHLASIVHVASHGTLDTARPMFSAIALAPASGADDAGPENDGRLETHEVLGLTVNSALVYLSGCETALGASGSTGFRGGEDYTTLAQAFLFAGARNVIATLWRIDDRGASEFATRFYGALRASTPASALATAQRNLIHDPKYALPYYWAAYTVSGAGTNP